MFGKSNFSSVKGGRIRVRCSRCKKIKYAPVTPGTRLKIVRCSCGLSTRYTLNYRAIDRELVNSRAQAILMNGSEVRIYLADTSSQGIGFVLKQNIARSMSRGHEIKIKYRTSTGSVILRRVKVMNITGNRVGARYLDNRPTW